MIIIVGYVPKPEGRAALGRAIEEAKLRGGRLVVVNASRGDALVDAGYAGVQDGAELVVIGMRHRTAVGKFLLGSTAQRILLDTPCPVLSVKADSRAR